jgi:hypothetical protein
VGVYLRIHESPHEHQSLQCHAGSAPPPNIASRPP